MTLKFLGEEIERRELEVKFKELNIKFEMIGLNSTLDKRRIEHELLILDGKIKEAAVFSKL